MYAHYILQGVDETSNTFSLSRGRWKYAELIYGFLITERLNKGYNVYRLV